jgi:hypothetical protein
MRILPVVVLAAVHGACVTADTGPLSLDVETSSRVAGTYLHDDFVVGFDISRGEGAHSTRFTSEDGASIVDIQVAGDRQRLTVLGGELVVDGTLGSLDPEVHGDLLAMRRLDVHRELYAIEEIYLQLEDSGIDRELLAPSAPVPGAPHVLAPGESTNVWTTFGPGPRTFELVNATPTCAAIALTSLPGGREVVLASGAQSLTRYGWSGLIQIENVGEWTAWKDPVCAASPVSVRVGS